MQQFLKISLFWPKSLYFIVYYLFEKSKLLKNMFSGGAFLPNAPLCPSRGTDSPVLLFKKNAKY